MLLHTCMNVANNKKMTAPRKMFFVDKMSNILSNGKSLILFMILNLFCKQNYISSCRGIFIFLVTGVFKTSFRWRGMLVNSSPLSLIYLNYNTPFISTPPPFLFSSLFSLLFILLLFNSISSLIFLFKFVSNFLFNSLHFIYFIFLFYFNFIFIYIFIVFNIFTILINSIITKK